MRRLRTLAFVVAVSAALFPLTVAGGARASGAARAADVSAVTAAQAQAAAAKYWDPAKLQIVAVGDASKVTDILKAKGTLEVFDAEGKPRP